MWVEGNVHNDGLNISSDRITSSIKSVRIVFHLHWTDVLFR